jgi:hypothetical protein
VVVKHATVVTRVRDDKKYAIRVSVAPLQLHAPLDRLDVMESGLCVDSDDHWP